VGIVGRAPVRKKGEEQKVSGQPRRKRPRNMKAEEQKRKLKTLDEFYYPYAA
jgi:hypothetical protein